MHKVNRIDPASPLNPGIASFRLDPVSAPKSWPKMTGRTVEEAIETATQHYSALYSELGKIPFGDPHYKPHNPAALDTIFIELKEKSA